jgi:hypothetical protein
MQGLLSFSRASALCILPAPLLFCAIACFDGIPKPAPTVCGIYSLHVSDKSIHHGKDVLIIKDDHTYVHVYTEGSSKKDLIQSGSWEDAGRSIEFSGFVAWDLFGPLPDGVMYPDPTGTSLPLKERIDGNFEIDAGPDRGETFVQVERCAEKDEGKQGRSFGIRPGEW